MLMMWRNALCVSIALKQRQIFFWKGVRSCTRLATINRVPHSPKAAVSTKEMSVLWERGNRWIDKYHQACADVLTLEVNAFVDFCHLPAHLAKFRQKHEAMRLKA
jgi:hypothetical protein